MESERSPEGQTRDQLMRRFRCVAFAALGAGLSRDELQAGIEIAVTAEARRRAFEIPAPRRALHSVPPA